MLDIEDINNHTKNPEFFKIYSEIIIDLIEWVKNYKGDEDSVRNKFALYMNKQSRSNYKNNKDQNILFKKNVLVNVFRKMIENKTIIINSENKKDIDTFKRLLQKKPSRNISGITSVTLLTSPTPNGQTFSCEHNCYYCPNEPAHEGNNFQEQPRSYLYDEPAVRRANKNGFLAINQMISRLDVLFMNGHEIDKLEIILEGGTYTEYPANYLEEYHRDIFYIANTYFDKNRREPLSISEEIRINKTSQVHIIGVCIETRPDAINDTWIKRFREWGVTRIQIGVQHTDNSILKKINRGHTIEQVLTCMKYLKDNCFKIDIHAMPDLPFSTPEMDKSMFDYIYSVIHPDQMKIYPCEVTPWTVIEKWYKSGKYQPYSEEVLFDVMKYGMITCPPYVRLPRVIRDIPNIYIQAGNKHTNLRQLIDNHFENEGKMCMDIRTREIGRHPSYYNREAEYTITKFNANGGLEYFIEYQSLDKKVIFGFIRMRFPTKEHNPVFSILKNKALIRELHVYGSTNIVGKSSTSGIQHNGIGTKLLKIAEWEAKKNFYTGIVVISGEGVKGYYEKRGYKDIDTYMVKYFYKMNISINKNIINIINKCNKNIINIINKCNENINNNYNFMSQFMNAILIIIICILNYNIGYFIYIYCINYISI